MTKPDATVGAPRIAKVGSSTTAFSSVLGMGTRLGRVESDFTVGSLGTRPSALSTSNKNSSGFSRILPRNASIDVDQGDDSSIESSLADSSQLRKAISRLT